MALFGRKARERSGDVFGREEATEQRVEALEGELAQAEAALEQLRSRVAGEVDAAARALASGESVSALAPVNEDELRQAERRVDVLKRAREIARQEARQAREDTLNGRADAVRDALVDWSGRNAAAIDKYLALLDEHAVLRMEAAAVLGVFNAPQPEPAELRSVLDQARKL